MDVGSTDRSQKPSLRLGSEAKELKAAARPYSASHAETI